MTAALSDEEGILMDFYVMMKAYDAYGGHTTTGLIPDFLLLGAKDFGNAIKQLTVTLHIATSGSPKQTLEETFEEHHQYRSTLPKIVFRRKRAQIAIDVSSEIMDGLDWKPSPRLSLPLFIRGVNEVIDALSLMKSRVKATDAFDLDSFLAHCRASKARFPSSEDDLQVLAAQLNAAHQAKLDALSPWEKLGIEWDDFHPMARTILDEPFFWESANDFSPHGNDTGADLLSDYRNWIKRHKDGQPIAFLERLAKQWGYTGIDQMDEEIRDAAAIALAFAEIKLRGCCDERARDLAMMAIGRQRVQAVSSSGWPHREERLRTLTTMEAKLRSSVRK